MRNIKLYNLALALLVFLLCNMSCTKLDTPVYSNVLNDNFWKTPDQIAAGIAPAYAQLTALVTWNTYPLNTTTTDEQIVPTRGNDWYDNGNWQRLWLHTWTASDDIVNSSWNDLFNGIGRCNFILDVVNNLPAKPDNVANINAELKILRAYYYYMAMDMFGNVPIVKDFKTDPSTVKNNTRQEVFNFIETELNENIPLVTSDVSASTYGRSNKWVGFSILAKLYLNAKVYTGTDRYTDCIKACDSIIMNAPYALEPVYFDNFKPDNGPSNKENIFVVPFDHTNIRGNPKENQTLHYDNVSTFGLPGGMWNGFCTHANFYYTFDTSSTYTVNGNNTYRTFRDQRTGQYLVGQQFSVRYPYPQHKDILYASTDNSIKLKDGGTGLPLIYEPNFNVIASSEGFFRLVGARSIKYFPEAGTTGDISNDVVIFRYADILLMKAEALLRSQGNTAQALDLVNQVRLRAYSNDNSGKWTLADLTLPNLLKERGRELAWEGWRRQDMIRYEVTSGTQIFGAARVPGKAADPADGHLNIFPIPSRAYSANKNLVQNPGYPPF